MLKKDRGNLSGPRAEINPSAAHLEKEEENLFNSQMICFENKMLTEDELCTS